MIAKIFRSIATFIVRIGGIVLAIISLFLLYYSLYFCKNLLDILAINDIQITLSGWRLFSLFIMNFIALVFDWIIALIIFASAISMILYKTKTLEKYVESEKI